MYPFVNLHRFAVNIQMLLKNDVNTIHNFLTQTLSINNSTSIGPTDNTFPRKRRKETLVETVITFK